MAHGGNIYSDLPEVSFASDLPEVVANRDIEAKPHSEGLQVVQPLEERATPPRKALFGLIPAKHRLTRRKRLLFAALAAGALVLALIIGLSVGLTVGKNSGNSKSDPKSESTDGSGNTDDCSSQLGNADDSFGTPFCPESASDAETACTGTICPAVLAVAKPRADSTFIFARGTDGAVWCREADGTRWIDDWTSLGGTFQSQPAVVSDSEGKMDVFGIWADRSLRTLSYRDGSWSVSWTNLEGVCYAAPTTCSTEEGRFDVYTLDARRILAHKWNENGEWKPGIGDGDWDVDRDTARYFASSPIAICLGPDDMTMTGFRNTGPQHDFAFLYGNGSLDFTQQDSQGGSYIGDPTVVSRGSGVLDFFGVGAEDRNMYYISWSKKDGYSSRGDDLGGKFQSAASAIVTGDLGGYWDSAPSVVSISDGKIAIFGIGANGTMMHGRWTVGESESWGKGEWFVDGAKLSSERYRNGPA